VKRRIAVLGILLALYLATGLYVVGGNQKGVVRRFGRAVRTQAGLVDLRPSGLHYDLPWPLAQVDRINLNEVRTLSVGSSEEDETETGPFLKSVNAAGQSQFLTGDKNILSVHFNVHYRVSEFEVDDFLFASESPQRRLQLLAEAALADLALRSGVDFVHTLGRNELREMLIVGLRELVDAQRLGLVVDDVTIAGVYPPLRVKAQFLDVMNARADKETYINQALAYAAQRKEDAGAEASKKNDEAEIYHHNIVEDARGTADSFLKIVSRFELDQQQGIQTAAQSRQMAMKRQYIDAMEDIFRKVSGKVLLDSGKPVDLTIFRDPKE
jgi:membrane protease subunit HflK